MKISVVMSVYNGAGTVGATIESILAQTERDFELIVVDDGSSDATPAILSSYAARDPRIRVVTQDNSGLTRALIRGCELARGEIIARHDADDRSLPERFRKQLEVLRDDVVLVSCWSRVVGPGREHLYDMRADGDEVRASLLRDDVGSIRGLTGHGTSMFRRADYVAAGGYRAAFWFAQDLDLWLRFAPRGRIVFVPEVLYEVRYEPGAISASRRGDQVALATIALELRDHPERESELLARATAIRPRRARGSRRAAAQSLYFIASCLRTNGDVRFRRYARMALRKNPLNLRAWLILLRRLP
jgi:glycosyltransferase involved in cell wall biosynthesis